MSEYIELNLSNYTDEDVAQLNDWAIDAHLAIANVLDQKFDDICWLDVYKELGQLIGVEYQPELLPEATFLNNCKRFYQCMKDGVTYKS